jgi:hypothetical protein
MGRKYINIPKGEKPNAMIADLKSKKRIFRCIPENEIPESSFEIKYDNLWMHLLIKEDDKYRPIDKENVADKTITPTDIYVAKNCAEEVREVYGISMPLTEKIKWGIFIGICAIDAILVFFIIAMSSGVAK